MLDNRGDWGTLDVGAPDGSLVFDRAVDAIVAFGASLADLARFLMYRADLQRSRRQLSDLTDEQLRDIGLTRREAEREARRPFFEA